MADWGVVRILLSREVHDLRLDRVEIDGIFLSPTDKILQLLGSFLCRRLECPSNREYCDIIRIAEAPALCAKPSTDWLGI